MDMIVEEFFRDKLVRAQIDVWLERKNAATGFTTLGKLKDLHRKR